TTSPSRQYADRERVAEGREILGLWQIGRLLALENSPNIDAYHPIQVRQAVAVCYETASPSEVGQIVDRGYSMACCERGETVAPAEEKGIGGTEKRTDSRLRYTCKRDIKRFCENAGIDITKKAIWRDRTLLLGGLFLPANKDIKDWLEAK